MRNPEQTATILLAGAGTQVAMTFVAALMRKKAWWALFPLAAAVGVVLWRMYALFGALVPPPGYGPLLYLHMYTMPVLVIGASMLAMGAGHMLRLRALEWGWGDKIALLILQSPFGSRYVHSRLGTELEDVSL